MKIKATICHQMKKILSGIQMLTVIIGSVNLVAIICSIQMPEESGSHCRGEVDKIARTLKPPLLLEN